MRNFVISFLSVSILPLFVFASGSDLNIRVDAIRDRQNTYASAADFLEINLFTPRSLEIERQYNILMQERRQQSIYGIFADNHIDTLSEGEKIQAKAESLGLFKTGVASDRHFRPAAEDGPRQYNPIIVFPAILVLCIMGFLFTRRRHKLKKRRKRSANNSHYSYKRQ